MKKNFTHNGTTYTMTYENGDNYITFENCNTGNSYKIIVKENNDFVWKLNKKSISAIDGARGLFSFFCYSLKNEFMESYLYKTLAFFNI